MTAKVPEFIRALKTRTIRTTERTPLSVKLMNEQRARLKEISEQEGVSEAKLVESAIDLIHEKWMLESGRKAS